MSATQSSTMSDSDLSKDIFHQIIHSTFPSRQSNSQGRPATALPSQSSAPKENTRLKASDFSAYSDKVSNRNRTWSGCKVKNSAQQVQPENRCTCSTGAYVVTPWQAGRSSTERDKAGNKCSAKVNPNLRRNQQEQRLLAQLAVIDQCRIMRRESEMIQHRLDARYYICGSQVPLLDRYSVSEADIQRQQTMAEVGKELKIDLHIKHPYYSRTMKTNKNKSKTKAKADNKRSSHKSGKPVQESCSLTAAAVAETEPAALDFQPAAGETLASTSPNPEVTPRNEDHINSGQPEVSSPHQTELKTSFTDGDGVDEGT